MGRQNDHLTHGPDNLAVPKSKKITRTFYDHHFPQLVFFPLRKFVLMLRKHAWRLPHFNGCRNEISSHFTGCYFGHVKVKMAASELEENWLAFIIFGDFHVRGFSVQFFFFFLRTQTALAINCGKTIIWDKNSFFNQIAQMLCKNFILLRK